MDSTAPELTRNEGPAAKRPFASYHSWDRNFYLLMSALAWVGILRGFGGDMADHISQHQPAYPLIVHFHAVVFVSWLILFTAQILLIRSRKIQVHMRLGFAMIGLAVVMAFIGPATALTVQHHGMSDPKADPAFLSIQFTDILAFVGLTTAAIFTRKKPNVHKRLILLATLYITDAGFARWLSKSVIHALGFGYWSFWLALYLGPIVLVALAGLYDLITRRRLHPAYVMGTAWMFGVQMLSVSLYFSPTWLGLSKRIIAAWPW